MKIFKKILAGVVSAAVIVSALAVPVAALTPTTDHVRKSGKINLGKKTITYSSDTAASTTQASATLTCQHSMVLCATIETFGEAYGILIPTSPKGDAISGTSVSVTLGNVFVVENVTMSRNITSAVGTYTIGDINYSSTVK